MRRLKLDVLFVGVFLLVLGFCCCLFGPRLLRAPSGGGVKRSEEMRVTSPDDRFDAVLVRDSYGGALGGIEWYAYIVRKGRSAPSDSDKAVFWAESLRGENILWKRPHLVELQYDHALIVKLRNLWALDMIEGVGSAGEGDYYVEVRLDPTSPDFSLLQPNGEFGH